MKLRVLATVLALLCLFTAFAVLARGVDVHDHSADTPLTSATAAINAAGSYYLDENVTLPGGLTISGSGVVVDLCLNGHMLTVPGGIQVKDGATLNILDCYTPETHVDADGGFQHTYDSAATLLPVTVDGGVITTNRKTTVVKVTGGATLNLHGGTLAGGEPGNVSAGGAGGIYTAGGVVNIYGGVIRDNMVKSSTGGGAVCASADVSNTSTINIYGGEIKDNVSAKGAGAIYAADGGTTVNFADLTFISYGVDVNVYGGAIHGNCVTSAGANAGGMYIGQQARFSMYGGSITGNDSVGTVGGIYFSGNVRAANFSGSACVRGNYAGSTADSTGVVSAHGAVSDVYISCESSSSTGSTVIPRVCIAGALADSADIGITYGSTVTETIPVLYPGSGYSITANDLSRLTSNNSELSMFLGSEGNILLCRGRIHYACGAFCEHTPVHSSSVYEPLAATFTGGVLYSGSYYLTKNITLTAPIVIMGEVNLCLEGYGIACTGGDAIEIPAHSTLNLTDCYVAGSSAPAEYTHTYLTQYNGTVTTIGGAVYGTVLEQSGGVVVTDGGCFNLFGGTIGGAYMKSGVAVTDGGSFCMYGGTIDACFTKGLGGGVYADASSTFALNGGSIVNNYAGTQGGGVYAEGGLSLSGAVTVTDNTCLIWRSNIYLPYATEINVTGPVSGTIGVRMAENGVFTTGGAGSYVRAFTADAETGTYVDTENGELIVTSYGVNIQPSTEQPTVVMKGFENVESYQWYRVTCPADTDVVSITGKAPIDLNAGDTLKVIPAVAGAKALYLAVETSVTIDNETVVIMDIQAESSRDENGAYFITAPLTGMNTYYLVNAAEEPVAAQYSIYRCTSAVTSQAAATFTGGAGWYICRAAYVDGVTVVYSQPFYCENHKHAACGGESCTHDGAHSEDLPFTPLANDFTGGLMIGENPDNTYLLSDGAYYLASDLVLARSLNIDGTVVLCLNGHTLTVTGASALNVADGASLIVCTCGGEAASVISGTTAGNGGAIYSEGDAELLHITLKDCTAANGGAIYAAAGSMTLYDCIVQNNSAAVDGGDVYAAAGTVTLARCALNGSSAANLGGSICVNGGSVVLEDSTVTDCTAGLGGGVYLADGGVTLRGDVHISGNVGCNVHIAAGKLLTPENLAASACVGISAENYGVFTTGGADYLDSFQADVPGGFVTVDEDALTLEQYAILQQPTGNDRTIKVNDAAHAAYRWFKTEEEKIEAPEEPLTLTAGQILVLTPDTAPDEGTRATLISSVGNLTATLREDNRFVFYITADGTYRLPELSIFQYEAVCYTLDGVLEDQTTETLSAPAGAYFCDVVYVDGTVLRSELVVVDPVFFAAATQYSNPYADVNQNDWYYEAVMKAAEKKLMIGVSEDEFAPEDPATRGMVVTVMWRMDDEATGDMTSLFVDVRAEDYFYTAVDWAASNGIVVGISEREFAPELTVTREQAVTLLYRYTEKKLGLKPAGAADLSRYADAPSDWAAEAMRWAVARGYVKANSSNQLRAQEPMTRAQLADLIVRYLGL